LDAQALQILKQTIQYFEDKYKQAYLVGGSLRNLLLGEPTIDWDIVTDGDAHGLARGLADKFGGHYAHMNEKASRVVFKQDMGEIVLDVSPLNGNTIEDDLRRRDFTINAMAVPLGEVVRYLEQLSAAQEEDQRLPDLEQLSVSTRGRSTLARATARVAPTIHGFVRT